VIHGLEAELAELMPRLNALATERDRAMNALQQAKQVAEAEERRRADVAARVAQHRELQAKNQATLNSVTSMREATAATAQFDQSKRMIDEDEQELSTIGHRLVEANRVAHERERIATELETAQTQARESLGADQTRIEAELTKARKNREKTAGAVPRTLLTKYDRIRSKKRVHAIFALRGSSCGHCDTTLPLQRRSILTASGGTEICEGCGVMLYAPD
jgi:hypothetical protein